MGTISRDALFELVWAEPVSTIAQRLGVSDVWLKKCCGKTDVPVPDRGYWAKLRAGKTVNRQKLPPRPPGTPIEITIRAEPQRSRWPIDPEAELAEPPPIEPVFPERIEAVIKRIERSLDKVRLARDFTAPHDVIRRALDEDELRRLKPEHASYRFRYSNPLFDAPFERRRLRILNSLFLALTKAGHRPWLNDPQARNLGVTVGSQPVSFSLDHREARSDANRPMQAPREAYEILRLDIPGTGDSWTDDDGGRIEDRLREITLKLIVAGEILYRANTRGAYEHACRHRAEMERMLVERRVEALRLAHERTIKAEATRRKTLTQMAADHRAAEDIRAFVRAVVEAPTPATGEANALNYWSSWALSVADQVDPVGRLQIADDGQATIDPVTAIPSGECN